MLRIVSGSARGRRIQSPPGRDTRPTSERTREALFSSLEARVRSFAGRAFLDLYAGSGAVGLEAASRGAAHVVLVESDPKTAAIIQRNIASTGLSQASVIVGAVESAAEGARLRGPFDIVFADPPYALEASELAAVLEALLAHGSLAEGAHLVVERSRRDAPWQWPDGIEALSDRTYGEGTLWYGRAAVGTAPAEPEA